MKKQLLELEKRATEELEAVSDANELEKFRITYLGKKGLLTSIMKKLGEVSANERPEIGKLANLIKSNLSQRFEDMREGRASGKAT